MHVDATCIFTEQFLGGDGLDAARHLFHYGYAPTVYYPKQSKNDLYQVLHSFIAYFISKTNSSKRLTKQLKDLKVPFTEDFDSALKQADHIVDAIFGTLPLIYDSPFRKY